jgi:hypothetical protein
VRDAIKAKWQMRRKPVLSDAERSRLEAIFDEDLALLGRLLGTELSCRTFKQTVRDRPLEWV